MKVEIISIGTELLLSQILNTNAAHAARCLDEIHVNLAYQVTVGDVPEDMVNAMRTGMARCDAVIVIGGLGQEENDYTRRAAAEATQRELLDELPGIAGARVLGAAPLNARGLLLEEPESTLICLPGRPREMAYLLETEVLPYLQRRQAQSRTSNWVLLRTAGLMESTLSQLLSDLALTPQQQVTFSSYAGQTDIRLWAEGDSRVEVEQGLSKLARQVYATLGDHIFGSGEARLERVLLEQMRQAKVTLTLAECHTNGSLRRSLESVPGATSLIAALPAQTDEELAEQLAIAPFEADNDLTRWCRLAAERLREDSGSALSLVIYRYERPGGVQLLVTLASAHGVSVTQRSFGGHPDSMEDWASTLGMVHLRRWLLSHAGREYVNRET